jgi:para-nitrobenzyl esterase
MRTLSVLVLLASVAATRGASGAERASADSSSRRLLPAGEVVGATSAYGSHVWRGIPYAEPPVGSRRWRAPRPAPPWAGPLEALASGPPCLQFASVYAGGEIESDGQIGAEDCLTLDVWAPRFEPDQVPRDAARLPVMFWIHGGGNTIGSAGFYDGGNLAATQSVVVVAVQYRLGPLGWFRHASLRGEDTTAADRSGNFGTLDVIRALEWVQENVSAFGGDPARVTVFGESAGGGNVLSLVLSPLAQGLFHRAILQSAGFRFSTAAEAEHFADHAEPGLDRSSSEVLTRLLVADGTAADRAAARGRLAAMPEREIEAYLRGKTGAELLAVYPAHPSESMYDLPQRFRDGYVLPGEAPLARLERGAYNRVPIMLGTNRDEDKLFMIFDRSLVHWRFGLFPRARDDAHYQARSEHQAHAWKARAVDGPATILRRTQGPSVYAYRWDWDEEPGFLLYDGPGLVGAAHGLEIPFVFGHWDVGPQSWRLFTWWNRDGRRTLSAQMMSYWAAFAYEGAPARGRGGDLPAWPAWDDSSPDAPKYVVLDTPADGGVRLASETWTLEKVMAAIDSDPRLPNPRDKCALLRNLATDEYITRSEYASANGELCAEFAFAAYPWSDVAAGR